MVVQTGFVSELVRNPEDRFYHDAAHIIQATVTNQQFWFCEQQRRRSVFVGGGGLITSARKVRADFLLSFDCYFVFLFEGVARG